MKRYLLLIAGIYSTISSFASPTTGTTIAITPGTTVVMRGSGQATAAGGSFINNGIYIDTTGTFNALGAFAFSGSGTTNMNNLVFNTSSGTSVFNSLVSVYNITTITAGNVNANNDLYIRSDAGGATMVNNGSLTGNVQGLITQASTTGEVSDYTSNLSLNISGSVMAYQWESSPDNITWSPIAGATNATYTATVTATVYYSCSLSTTNSVFAESTSSVELPFINTPPTFNNGTTQGFSICENATAYDITSLLTVSDIDAVQTETWTISSAPNNGGTLGGFSTANTASSGSTNITPGNAVTYMPAAGFSGTETFAIQVSDGAGGTATTTFTVTVNPTPAPIYGNMSICGTSTTTLATDDGAGNWTSSNANVTIDGSGNATGVSAGTATITYTNPTTGCMTSTTVLVNNLPNAGSISGAASELTGGSINLTDGAGGWAAQTSMTTAMAGAAVAAVNDNIYIMGGLNGGGHYSSVEVYNITNNIWGTVSSMPGIRYQGDGAGVINGKIYVPGGWTPVLPHNTLFIYDPSTDTWTNGATMPSISAQGVTGVINNKLYVTTAANGVGGYANYLFSYDPTLDSWTTLAGSPSAHASPAGGVINGKLYVAGGADGVGNPTAQLDVYDPTTTLWSTKTSMPIAVSAPVSGVMNGKLYVVGGTSGGTTLNTMYIYDPVSDTWTTGPTALTASSRAGGLVANNGSLFFIGGFNSGYLTNNASFTPYTWSSSNTAVATVNQSGAVAGIAGGTTTITYTAGSTCTSIATAPITVLAPINGASAVCVNASITLSDVTTGGAWSSSNANATVDGSGNVTGQIAGTAVISYVASTSTVTATVTVNPLPTSTGVTNSGPICNGGTVSLNDNSINADTWAWTGSDASSSTVQSPVMSRSATTTYSLTLSNSVTGCNQPTVYTTTVSVNPVPSSTGITSNNPICIGGTVSLNDNSSNATAWSWMGSDGFSSTLQAPTATPTLTTTYSLTASSNGSGCVSPVYMTTVTVNPVPSSTGITNNNPICIGGTVTLNDNSSNATAWSWMGSDGFTSTLQVPTATPTVTTTYSLTASSNGSGCVSPVYMTTVTVNPVPSSTGITNNNPICIGGTVSLNDNSSNATAWSWMGSDGFTSTLQAPTATPTITTTYSLTASSNGSGCVSPVYMTTVTVNPVPSSTGATNDGPICIGGTVSLNDNSSNATAWSWMGSDGFTSTLQAPTATPTITTTYSLTASSNGSGCVSPIYTTLVTVNPVPSSTGATNSGPICYGTTVTLYDNSSNATSWSWMGSDGFSSPLQSPTATPTITTTYSLTASSDGSNCVSPVYTTTVTVYQLPDITAIPNQTLCNNTATVADTFNSSVGGTTYAWTNSNSSIGLASSGTSGIIASFIATNSGGVMDTGTIIVTPTANGCVGPLDTFMVIVNPTPTFIPSPIPAICQGVTGTTLSFSGLTGGSAYTAPTVTFPYTGSVQAYTVAPGITSLAVDMEGGKGGDYPGIGFGGGGGRVQCTMAVTPGQVYYVYVGQAGNDGGTGLVPPGGLNSGGGADGGAGSNSDVGAAGGAASDIRTSTPVIAGSVLASLNTRLIVAGGGGGASWDCGENGGPGGDTVGGNSYDCSTYFSPTSGGSQTAGGFGTQNYGAFGNGGDAYFSYWGGGGGGGWYGGGGMYSGSGGGGSSYPAINGGMISNLMHTQGANSSGNGYVTIAPVPSSITYTYSIVWSSAAITAGLTNVINDTVSTSPINISLPSTTAAGVYTGTVTLTSGPCSNSTGYPISVTVNPLPAVTPSIINQTLCNNTATVADTFNSSVAGTTYTWTNSNSSIGLTTTGAGNIIPSFTAMNGTSVIDTGIIVVTPTANSCVGALDTFMIIVNPTPSVDASADQMLCNGFATTTVDFSGSAVSGTTYVWTNNNLSIGLASVGTSDTIGSFTATNITNATDTGTIIVTPWANSCSGATDTFLIIVYPTPTVVTPANQALCNTDTTSAIIFIGSVVPTTYTWTNSNSSIGLATSGTGGTIAAFAATNITTATDTGTIVVTPTANGCVGTSQSFTIAVYPTPKLSSPLTMPAICDSNVFSYPENSLTTGTTYAWSRPSITGISGTPTSGIDSVNEIVINSMTYPIPVTYVYTLTANGCANTQSVIVKVNPNPFLNSPLLYAQCDSMMFSYSPSSATGDSSFTWIRPYVAGIDLLPGSGSGGVNEQLINTTYFNVVDTYKYKITAYGCYDSSIVTVTVHPTPKLSSATGPFAICSGLPFSNVPTSITPGTSFAWSRAAMGGITPGAMSDTGAINETLINSSTGQVVVTYVYTLTANGCTNSEDMNLTVNPNPDPVMITTAVTNVCENTLYQNFGAAISPAGYESYAWSVTDGTIAAVGNNGQFCVVNFNSVGSAVVTLTVKIDSTGCISDSSYTVTVSSSTSSQPSVAYSFGEFICLQNDVTSYQWGYDSKATLDSTILIGQINQSYANSNPDTIHNYYWVMTDQNGCMKKAYYNGLSSTAVSTINDGFTDVKIYPNPTSDYIKVAINTTLAGSINVVVTDMLGQKITEVPAVNNNAAVDVSKLASGVYIVDCYRDGIKIATAKFIKN